MIMCSFVCSVTRHGHRCQALNVLKLAGAFLSEFVAEMSDSLRQRSRHKPARSQHSCQEQQRALMPEGGDALSSSS